MGGTRPIKLFIGLLLVLSVGFASCTYTRVIDFSNHPDTATLLMPPPKDFVSGGTGCEDALTDLEDQTGLTVSHISRWTGSGWQRYEPDNFFSPKFDMYADVGYSIMFTTTATNETWEADIEIDCGDENGGTATGTTTISPRKITFPKTPTTSYLAVGLLAAGFASLIGFAAGQRKRRK